MDLKFGTDSTLRYATTRSADASAYAHGAQTRGKDAAAVKKVAGEFEALFVGMVLKSMRETVGKDPITDGGRGEELFRSLLDQEYARIITEHGGLGLSTMLEQQLDSSTQGAARVRPAPAMTNETRGVIHEN